MEIVFIGAGRLATNLAQALRAAGHTVTAVYSRHLVSAQALCTLVGGHPTDSLTDLPLHADAFIFAVSDAALPLLAAQLTQGRSSETFFHTAGSVPLSVLNSVEHHGVIYPMQTFSKECLVDFSQIPVFIEGSTQQALHTARQIASSVSQRVSQLSSADRRQLHLAAVFACNFANHCYALSADILERHGLDFSVMLPLIDETARKVHTLHPRQAQTGPAIRYDRNIIDAQSQLLEELPLTQQIYELMSNSIHQHTTTPHD